MSSLIDIAQDYMDCVAGDHGEWWQERANQFIEDNINNPNCWPLWKEIRRTEVAIV